MTTKHVDVADVRRRHPPICSVDGDQDHRSAHVGAEVVAAAGSRLEQIPRLVLNATGDNHAEAVALLKKAGATSHRHLATLLGLKTKAGYSHTPASSADVKKAARAAAQLVNDARADTAVGG